MKHYTLLFSLTLFLFSCNQSQKTKTNNYFKETTEPVPLQEIFPNVPYWNDYSKIFIYAPAFDFKEIEGAEKYKYTLTSDINQAKFEFDADQPNLALSPVWEDVPTGIINLNVTALDKSGKKIACVGTKRIYRASPFTGVHNSPEKPYEYVAKKALEYIYNLPHIQKWISDDEPDLNYSLYGYPSKIISSLINSMLIYSGLPSTQQEDSIKAMAIVVNMENHLVKISKSKHPLLRSFPPTYDMDFVNKRIKIPNITDENGVNNVATKNSNKLMILYGYEYANTLLNLYDRTKDTKYLNIALSIADAYTKLQLPDGSWNLNIDYNTAQPLDASKMMPTRLMMFVKRLEKEYGQTNYIEIVEKADSWIANNPIKTFFWEAQFEDVPTYTENYHNLSEYPPTDYAMFLLKYKTSDKNIQIAKELIRFAEDQFVIWENPPNDSLLFNQWASKDTVKWHTPCVLEQYHFYVPVDASADQMIKSYIALFENTSDSIYLQKATALANSITQVQQKNGEITTVWTKSGFETENWLNCMIFSAQTLLEFENIITKNKHQ